MLRRIVVVLTIGCGHHDVPPATHAPEDARRVGPPALTDAAPPRAQNIEPGDPPASMVVVNSEPRFYIDRTEVTVGDYRECVSAGACEPPHLPTWTTWEAKRPVTFVSAEQAWDYCAYRGKRLPNPKEWLRAALGDDGRKYPWGNGTPTCKLAVLAGCNPGTVANVGTKSAGASPYGGLDMAGNLGEYVNRDASGLRERIDPAASGGDLITKPEDLAKVFDQKTGYALPDEGTGFRCLRTPKS